MSVLAPQSEPGIKTAPTLAEAAEHATMVIRGLRSRLGSGTQGSRAPEPSPEPPREESADPLEQQLAEYFAHKTPHAGAQGALDELRNRVVDGVVDRLLDQWQHGNALESEVVDRLIRRVLDRSEL